MKKDFDIPKVKNLQLAIVREYNSDFRGYDWNVYLINQKQESLELLLIVINGYDAERKTAVTRHKIDQLPPQSVAKIEYIPEELLALTNRFRVSFFLDNTLYEKNYIIEENSISKTKAKALSLFDNSLGFLFD